MYPLSTLAELPSIAQLLLSHGVHAIKRSGRLAPGRLCMHDALQPEGYSQ